MAIYPSNGQVRFGDYESEVIEINPFLGMGEVLVCRDTGAAKMGPGHWNELPTLGAVSGGGGGGQVIYFTDTTTAVSNNSNQVLAFGWEIPAGYQEQGALYVMRASGTILQNAAASATLGMRLVTPDGYEPVSNIGSPVTLSQSASDRVWDLEAQMYLETPGASQQWVVQFNISQPGSALFNPIDPAISPRGQNVTFDSRAVGLNFVTSVFFDWNLASVSARVLTNYASVVKYPPVA